MLSNFKAGDALRAICLVGALTIPVACRPDDEAPQGTDDPSDPPPATDPENITIGKLKPYRDVNRMVNERLLKDPGSLHLRDYFQEAPSEDDPFAIFAPSLTDLLGGYNGDGLRNDLQNAAPNAVNLLLWYMALDGVSLELSQACLADGEAQQLSLTDLRTDVTELVKQLCAQADAGAIDDATLAALWQLVMRADAPATELESWKNFLKSDVLRGQDGPSVAHTAVMSMLYNPHFLLQK